MPIWTVANQKGGVGKTTTAVTLAGILAQQGKRVLLIDLDPQGSLTSYFSYNPDEIEDSVYTLFESGPTTLNVVAAVHETIFENIWILPSSIVLTTLDREMGTRAGMGLVLKKAIAKVANRFDYILLDCTPVLGLLMINALAACDKLLVPVQTEFLALKGLERMLHTLKMVSKSQQLTLPMSIIPTMYDQRTRASVDSLAELYKKYSPNVWAEKIPVDTKFRDASKAGKPLSYLYPRSHGVLAYQKLLMDLTHTESLKIEPSAV